MRTFRKHLAECLKDERFGKIYDEERELLQLSLHLQQTREKSGISQREVAQRARITQQQLSKLENGTNCNILTYLKASRAMGLQLSLTRQKTGWRRSPAKRKNALAPAR